MNYQEILKLLLRFVNFSGLEVELEVKIYKSEVLNEHLLEARLFSTVDGSMINSYLEILDENFVVKNKIVDDVWEYADWILIKEFV